MVDHRVPDPAGFEVRLEVLGPAATRAFAARLAARLRGGEILLLHGPLGAGKTCFVQGLCAALDIREEVTSPTFTIANRYEGRLVVHHLDFYRIGPADDLADIGLDAILDDVDDGRAVLVAEWPQRLVPLAPRRLELLALPGAAADARTWWLRGVPCLPAFVAAAVDPGSAPC